MSKRTVFNNDITLKSLNGKHKSTKYINATCKTMIVGLNQGLFDQESLELTSITR